MSQRDGQNVSRSAGVLDEKFEPFIREHMVKVYSTLAFTVVAATVGAQLVLYNLMNLGIWSSIITLIFLIILHFYKYNGNNQAERFACLLAFGFFSGQSLGPVMMFIGSIEPAMMWSVLVGTMITFVTISCAALASERGRYIFLGGWVLSATSSLAALSLLNIYCQSCYLRFGLLHIGIFLAAGYILYDTQKVIEKCYAGDDDIVRHAMDLYFDVLSLFRRLLTVLVHKETNERRK